MHREVFCFKAAQRKQGGSKGGMLASSQVTAEVLALCPPSAEAFHLGNCIYPHKAIHSILGRETRAITVELYTLVSLALSDEKEWEEKGNKDGEAKQKLKLLRRILTDKFSSIALQSEAHSSVHRFA